MNELDRGLFAKAAVGRNSWRRKIKGLVFIGLCLEMCVSATADTAVSRKIVSEGFPMWKESAVSLAELGVGERERITEIRQRLGNAGIRCPMAENIGDKCLVCDGGIVEEKEYFTVLNCGHWFCTDCIEKRYSAGRNGVVEAQCPITACNENFKYRGDEILDEGLKKHRIMTKYGRFLKNVVYFTAAVLVQQSAVFVAGESTPRIYFVALVVVAMQMLAPLTLILLYLSGNKLRGAGVKRANNINFVYHMLLVAVVPLVCVLLMQREGNQLLLKCAERHLDSLWVAVVQKYSCLASSFAGMGLFSYCGGRFHIVEDFLEGRMRYANVRRYTWDIFLFCMILGSASIILIAGASEGVYYPPILYSICMQAAIFAGYVGTSKFIQEWLQLQGEEEGRGTRRVVIVLCLLVVAVLAGICCFYGIPGATYSEAIDWIYDIAKRVYEAGKIVYGFLSYLLRRLVGVRHRI